MGWNNGVMSAAAGPDVVTLGLYTRDILGSLLAALLDKFECTNERIKSQQEDNDNDAFDARWL